MLNDSQNRINTPSASPPFESEKEKRRMDRSVDWLLSSHHNHKRVPGILKRSLVQRMFAPVLVSEKETPSRKRSSVSGPFHKNWAMARNESLLANGLPFSPASTSTSTSTSSLQVVNQESKKEKGSKDKKRERESNDEFVGIAELKRQHAETLTMFQACEQRNDYRELHASHYDWWMFPIDQSSSGKGDGYKLSQRDIDDLKGDKTFMTDLVEGVRILCKSWAWDFGNSLPITTGLGREQRWTWYSVRLFKAGACMLVFGLDDAFTKLEMFANWTESLTGQRFDDSDWKTRKANKLNNVVSQTVQHPRAYS